MARAAFSATGGGLGFRGRLACLLVVFLVSLIASSASASVEVIASGWRSSAEAAPEALRRASRWTDVLGLRMTHVLSTDPDDRFAETIAVFERPEPIPAHAFASPELALASLAPMVRDLVGSEPPLASELRTSTSGHSILWAQWIVDDLAYECVLAPSGDTTSLVVAVVLASELGQERAELDEIYEHLQGVTAAMPAFSLARWRFGTLALWLGLAALLHLSMLAFVARHHDHRQAGLRAAALLLPLVGGGTLLGRSMLLERELALHHAGASVEGLLMWIALSGVCVAALHSMIAQRFDRGVVRSAPATGAFASGTYSTADMVRSTIQKAALRDPSASSGAWARPRRLDLDDSGLVRTTESESSDSQRIVVDEAERLPPAPRS